MEYIYSPYDSTQYATKLLFDSNNEKLTWESAKLQDVLIVQTGYAVAAEGQMHRICGYLSGMEWRGGVYTEIEDNLWVRRVSAVEKAKEGGCQSHGKASRYTVFSIKEEGEKCWVFAPQDSVMISAHCDVPQELHYTIQEQIEYTGLFKKKAKKTGFYEIRFADDISDSYREGDISCTVEGFAMPVTRKMIQKGTVYVETMEPPRLLSHNKGLDIIEEGR